MAKAIFYKTDDEIELLRQSNIMVSKTLALVGELLRPGVKASYVDAQAEQYIRDNGGVPGFKGLYGFPSTLCFSKNEEVVHGIPTDDVIQDGDIVSVDCGVLMNSFYGDSAFTFPVGNVSSETLKLLKVTNESLYIGIKEAVVGNRVGNIGYAIQQYTEKEHGYGVVKDLVGHGVGKSLHEGPEVPNYGRRGNGIVMQDGLVIAIEPMINQGKRQVKMLKDGWTIVTRDGKPSAHFEHSVAVRKNEADILSDHSFVEEAIKKNPEINELSIKK